MNRSQNCWEYKKCGRERGGARAAELGVCASSVVAAVDGVNSGKNGGRACWVVGGTLCGGKVQGSFASKMANCMDCEFYRLVKAEEGRGFVLSKDILPLLSTAAGKSVAAAR
jgi:hypothetical protein